MLFLTNIDLNGNQLLGFRAEELAADPTGGGLYEGRVWYNTVSHLLKYYNGTTTVVITSGVSSLTVDNSSIEDIGSGSAPSIRVKALGVTNAMLAGSIANGKLATDPLARANHTGTQTASTISDFDTQVRTSRLDQMAAAGADVSMGTHKITNVTDPSSAQDAATKAYVDSVAAGLSPKDSVRAATAVAGTLATSFENADVIDGVTLATGDRILIKNQAAPAENGIYTVNASGAPTRTTDADSSGDLNGALCFVSEGTVNGNTLWVMTTDGTIVVNTTGLVWAQFGGPGTVTGGTGITVTGLSVALTIPVAISSGGTGQITAAAALTALGGTTKFSANVGDNSSTTIVVTHNLNTTDVVISVHRVASPFDVVYPEIQHTSVNTCTLIFATAPATNEYRIVVVG